MKRAPKTGRMPRLGLAFTPDNLVDDILDMFPCSRHPAPRLLPISSLAKKRIKYQTNLKVHVDLSSSHATHPMHSSFAVSSVLSLAAPESPCVAPQSVNASRLCATRDIQETGHGENDAGVTQY